MVKFYIIILSFLISNTISAQIANDCDLATFICNNQLAEKLTDGKGLQECPTGGCGCLSAGEKNSRWYKIKILNGGILEFNLNSYPVNSADYDFAVWNRGTSNTCPSGALLDNPDRCNYAEPPQLTGLKGTTNGNSNGASGNLFSNRMTVAAGDYIFILIDNYDGNDIGFSLDFFGPGIGTTATFDCSVINTCNSCSDPDCKTVRFASSGAYSFDETAAQGGCHSPFAYTSVKTATVCGTFTLTPGYNAVEFPLDRGLEITASNGFSPTTCLNSRVISYQVWDDCASIIPPNPTGSGFYTGLTPGITYKVCKTVTVSGADCWLSRICLPYWTVIANDVQCSATDLIVDTPLINQSNAGATSNFNAGCTGYQDVWYKFTAPASGRIQITANPDPSSDVKISLVGPMAGLDGGINDCDRSCSQMTNVVEGCNDYAGAGAIERLFAFVIPGQTYYVWVSGTASRPTANFNILVTENVSVAAQPTPGPTLIGLPGSIPSNDDCLSATDISPLCQSLSGTNIGATARCTDPDPEYVDALTLENNVWYKWTCPAGNGNAEVTFELTSIVCSAGINGSNEVQFGIFRGSCASLTPVISGTTSLTFIPISGVTYYFVIDGDAGAQCNFNVQIKRPTITSQSCTPGNYCTSATLPASFNYTYTGRNPGFRWAYCKSSTYNTPCVINLNNPATYSIYNSALGLPDPGCTPATYTFVGYLLADNGATTIAAGYPTPQPSGANCVNATSPCTFNIFPRLQNFVNVLADGCQQVVTVNPSCSAAVTVTGTVNQTVPRGTVGGNFSAVTVNFNAGFGVPPALCGNMTIQTPINCPNLGATHPCDATTLVHGAAGVATNNNIVYESVEDGTSTRCVDNYGKGVWFKFIAPTSGNTNINITALSANFNGVIVLMNSRDERTANGTYPNAANDFYTDDCSDCNSIRPTLNRYVDHIIACRNAGGNGVNETLTATGLNPGEEYYIMIDAFETSTSSFGDFTIAITDPGGGPVRPSNDDCINAIDLTNIGCKPYPSTNIKATSNCSNDLLFSGASTENSVWYTYTAPISGNYIINYSHANGYLCTNYLGAFPGIQFVMYTSNNNSCTGTFTLVPGSEVTSGSINGYLPLTLTAGQKYYIFVDGYLGNECTFDFQIYNEQLCCNADLGATEAPSNIVLCAGEEITIGVSANPINFGPAVKDNPVIGWQFSDAEPTGSALDPLDITNYGKSAFVGLVDWMTPPTSKTSIYKEWQGNYETEDDIGTLDGVISKPIDISGFPSGSTFNSATDTLTVCVYFYMSNFDNLWLRLRAPDGTIYTLADDNCGTTNGYLNVCFSNKNTVTNVNTVCPNAGNNYYVTGLYLPEGGWSGLDGEGINGTWTLEFEDNYFDGEGIWFKGFNLEIKKPITETTDPVVGPNHGDLKIVNNDPFKYGPQTFWLTPFTAIDYDAVDGYDVDSCYDYGTPVKVTLLERVTTPTYLATCAVPTDGSNGISLTLNSPFGGLPGLPLQATAMNSTVSSVFDNNTNSGGSGCNGAGVDHNINIVVPATSFPGTPTLTSINDIKVCLSIDHQYFRDLDVFISGPDAKCAELFTDVGPAGLGYLNNVCFYATAPSNISTYTTGDLINENRIPEGSLNPLLGTPLEGTWRVQIYDDAAGDIGISYQASIILQSATNQAYTVTGTGAASSISFPTAPPAILENESSAPFSVLDGQSWSVKFVDANNCQTIINNTYNKPNLGGIEMQDFVCDGVTVPFSVTTLPPSYTRYRISLDFDNYPQDINWILTNGENIVVASGGGYTLGGAVFTTANLDPEKGPYIFTLYDDYDDGLGSGGGLATGGGTTTQNFIKIEEVNADGTFSVLVNEIYGFCTPVPATSYCEGPNPSLFDKKIFNLGTPTGTFLSGVVTTLHSGAICAGASIVGATTLNLDGSGSINTNVAGITAGNTYSLKYSYTDLYGCNQTLCKPLKIFPTLSFAPVVTCPAATVNVNPTCPNCNATYIAEYSYDDKNSWTTSTTGTLFSLYLYGRVRNTLTNEIGCEIVSQKLAECPPVELPIELSSLVAYPVDNQFIKIDWTTISEVNTNYFELYRSIDGINFEKIVVIKAVGNSNDLNSYFYNDVSVESGILYYYKIIAVDIDNSKFSSNIVVAKLNDSDIFEYLSISPNPTNNYTILSIFTKNSIPINIKIHNDIGEIIFEENILSNKGMNFKNINTNIWPRGSYLVTIDSNEGIETKKLLIVK
jgi:subtilisin-like proprotein convertase family protein